MHFIKVEMVNGLKMVHKFIIQVCVQHLPKLWPGSIQIIINP